MENPEIDTQKYAQLIFGQLQMQLNEQEIILSTHIIRETGHPHYKNES